VTQKLFTTIGLMSGTSIDGVDAALIETDGYTHVQALGFCCLPYTPSERELIRACFGRTDHEADDIKAVEKLLTLKHAESVHALLKQTQQSPDEIDVIGFHGQTVFHAPQEGVTVQIGDGALLAQETGIDVVYDFRINDVKAGGQGAPLAPVYHKALAASAGLETPVVILNIGGVGNVTWIGSSKCHPAEKRDPANPYKIPACAGMTELLAFDTGPGNALMDDMMQRYRGQRYDKDGAIAAKGTVDQARLQTWLAHDYFQKPPPKSLDRDEWDIAAFGNLDVIPAHAEIAQKQPPDPGLRRDDISTLQNAMATLLEFSAETIAMSLDHMPQAPNTWYAAGGGRHNKALMSRLQEKLDARSGGALRSIDDLGWNGDAIEAECFAYLAVRSVLGLPLSFPTTTGVPKPLSGGIVAKAT
jgi:anhydro-N-acetylmuramic acid kinase